MRQRHRERVLEFLRTIQKPDRPLDTVAETDSLVESGLIDSLALLEIVAFLEEQYRIDFAAIGLEPEQLTSVSGILDLIEREAAVTTRDDRRGRPADCRSFHEDPAVIARWQAWSGPLLTRLTPARRRALLALAALWVVVQRPLKEIAPAIDAAGPERPDRRPRW